MRHTTSLGLLISLSLAAPALGCDPAPSGAVRVNIDSSGGTLALPEGRAAVRVPAGALAASTELAIEEVAPGGLGALPAGAVAVGPYIAITPHGTTFAAPVTVDLPYTNSGSSAGITVMRIDSPSDTSWEALPEAEFTGTRAVFPTEHFSIVVVTRYEEACGTDLAACCEAGSLSEADDADGDGCIGTASVLPCVAGVCGGVVDAGAIPHDTATH